MSPPHHTPMLVIDNTRPIAVADYPVGIRFVPHVPVPTPMGGWPRNGPARHIVIGAMPSARAGRPSARAVLRRLGNSATIAIAVFCAVYFGGQLIRGWLS